MPWVGMVCPFRLGGRRPKIAATGYCCFEMESRMVVSDLMFSMR